MKCSTEIAILMATYNGEKYISEQLDSIIAQTSSDWTLYIHDDGSSDGTVSIIKNYMRQYPDRIISIDGEPTGGACNNFMYLFEQIEAKIYMCSDQDDVWLPKKIEKTLESLLTIYSDDIPCLAFTEMTGVDEKLNVLTEKVTEYQRLNCRDTALNHIITQNVATGCTMMMNKGLRDMMIKCGNTNNLIMHDYWAALIASYCGKLVFLPEPTILYRQHSDNCIGMKTVRVSDAIAGSGGSKIKKKLIATRIQAGELADMVGADKDSLPRIYSELGGKSKPARIMTYLKYRLRNSTFTRTVGLYVFG